MWLQKTNFFVQNKSDDDDNNNNNNNCSYVLQDGKPDFVLSLLLIVFTKTKTFVLIKLFLKKKSVQHFEKIIKSSHFLHLTSINWLGLKIRFCFET